VRLALLERDGFPSIREESWYGVAVSERKEESTIAESTGNKEELSSCQRTAYEIVEEDSSTAYSLVAGLSLVRGNERTFNSIEVENQSF
jgi:hypothetical protein